MKLKIDYFDAINLLEAYSRARIPNIECCHELQATISHWIQTPDTLPIYFNQKVQVEWTNYLKAYVLAQQDDFEKRISKKLSLDQHTLEIVFDSNSLPFPPIVAPVFKFIDLFAGIGGFRIALQRHGGKCVFSSEWDNSARTTYFRNFGEVPFGDIRQFTSLNISESTLASLIPDHDILAAGFPCQPFSLAGLSARNSMNREHGFACETQGTLFFDIVRIAKVKRPKILFLENVKNLVQHNSGQTFSIIERTIREELGYSFAYKIIDARTKVPQKRQRCYIVCFRNPETQFQFQDSWFDGQAIPLRTILETDPDDQYTISQALWQGHINRSTKNKKRGAGFVATVANLDEPANTIVARYGKDGKECLIPQQDQPPRMLTIREAARVQGFPETFIPATSRTPAYKQFGNSVAVPVIETLASELIPFLPSL